MFTLLLYYFCHYIIFSNYFSFHQETFRKFTFFETVLTNSFFSVPCFFETNLRKIFIIYIYCTIFRMLVEVWLCKPLFMFHLLTIYLIVLTENYRHNMNFRVLNNCPTDIWRTNCGQKGRINSVEESEN